MKRALVIVDHPITHLGAARLLGDQGHASVGQAMSDAFRDSVRMVEARECRLTPRQPMARATLRAGAAADPRGGPPDRDRHVWALIRRGHGLQAIADDLGVTDKTRADASFALEKKPGVNGISGLMKFAMDSEV